MIKRDVSTIIDPEKCSGCGLCIKVCPSGTISMEDGIAKVTGAQSLACGHCAAICPESAVKVTAIDPNSLEFDQFSMDKKWMGYGKFPTSDLARLMASRRSCRNFINKPVEKSLLMDLIKLSTFAPSGTNCQQWSFTCISSKKGMAAFGQSVGSFFKQLNKKASNAFLRNSLKLFGFNALDSYYKEYYDSVNEALLDMEKNNIDRLFHGAGAGIIVGSGSNASCPKEDSILAAGNILLAAHTMGLGTCMIGFAVEAMKRDNAIKKSIGIPLKEKIHAVIALGYPDEKYQRITGRKKATIRFV